jgi:hypothetical protein
MHSKNLVNFNPWKLCTIKKTQKSCTGKANIFISINLKIKEKSGAPFLPLFTFPASFNNICLKSGELL